MFIRILDVSYILLLGLISHQGIEYITTYEFWNHPGVRVNKRLVDTPEWVPTLANTCIFDLNHENCVESVSFFVPISQPVRRLKLERRSTLIVLRVTSYNNGPKGLACGLFLVTVAMVWYGATLNFAYLTNGRASPASYPGSFLVIYIYIYVLLSLLAVPLVRLLD